jgi:hypothetical protein
MSIAAIIGAITALGAIAGVVKYWSQITVWLFSKSSAQKEQDIDKKVNDSENKVESGDGRPKWD